MWMTRTVELYERTEALQRELAAERAARQKDRETYSHHLSDAHQSIHTYAAQYAEQKAALAVAQTNFEWARLRMNQLEGERSQLFAHVLKIPLAPMVVDREPAPSLGSGLPFGLGADVSFEDMGDDMAKSMGLQDA